MQHMSSPHFCAMTTKYSGYNSTAIVSLATFCPPHFGGPTTLRKSVYVVVAGREVKAEAPSSRSNTLSMGPEDRYDDDDTTRVEPRASSDQRSM